MDLYVWCYRDGDGKLHPVRMQWERSPEIVMAFASHKEAEALRGVVEAGIAAVPDPGKDGPFLLQVTVGDKIVDPKNN